jgi:hypothetical protein
MHDREWPLLLGTTKVVNHTASPWRQMVDANSGKCVALDESFDCADDEPEPDVELMLGWNLPAVHCPTRRSLPTKVGTLERIAARPQRSISCSPPPPPPHPRPWEETRHHDSQSWLDVHANPMLAARDPLSCKSRSMTVGRSRSTHSGVARQGAEPAGASASTLPRMFWPPAFLPP